jgi:hypothetical protein
MVILVAPRVVEIRFTFLFTSHLLIYLLHSYKRIPRTFFVTSMLFGLVSAPLPSS